MTSYPMYSSVDGVVALWRRGTFVERFEHFCGYDGCTEVSKCARRSSAQMREVDPTAVSETTCRFWVCANALKLYDMMMIIKAGCCRSD